MITDACINGLPTKRDKATWGGGLWLENGLLLINVQFIPPWVLSMTLHWRLTIGEQSPLDNGSIHFDMRLINEITPAIWVGI
jgi:hypothetical protein